VRPYYDQNGITLYQGDLRDVLPTLPEASVDFVVTDPPYGICFMEMGWDHAIPGPTYWESIARACKPGALLLAFGGTRTYHRLCCAIEDAGWEIRDCLMWLYGQGMPKAGDIGKLIDKSKGAAREVVGTKLDRPGYHLHEGKGNGCYGNGKGLHAPGTDARLRAAQITAPATPEAAKWTGWAMALKPAWEPIVLAMKPMDGTIAHNALAWGVAGMNIEGARVGTESTIRTRGDSLTDAGWSSTNRSPVGGSECGRWPANLLLDEEAAAQLDAQTGTLTSGKMKAGQQRNRSKGEGGYHGDFPDTASATGTYGDSGGASRFFYCAKATKKERGPGNNHPTVKPLGLMKYLLTLLSTPEGGVILDPFAGSGTTPLAAKRLGRRCIAVELEEHNCKIAAARLQN
jgi:DNA modification methylase